MTPAGLSHLSQKEVQLFFEGADRLCAISVDKRVISPIHWKDFFNVVASNASVSRG
jgi:hypothetical protein